MEEMGDRIKRLRSENHMTLEELGNKVGVGKSTVRKWENGIIANMRRDKIAKLSAALGVSPAYLKGWESSTTSSPKKVDSSEELVNIYEQLIPNNQKKVLTYSKSLLSAQQMEEELLEPNAAHGMNPTGEEIKHADDVMKNDSEWI